ncbi:MAG: MFS transporter [Chloroflexota bacterium]|nr:MFS transporter [Chloroflexota bacterium]
MAFAYAIAYGTGLGGIFTLEAVIFADYFGRNFLGSIRGFVLPFQTVGAAIGPLVSGLFYDLTGHYEGAFAIFAVGFGLSALLAFMAKRPTREGKSLATGSPEG